MQAEGIKQSQRMVITPRQDQDNSEEISTLKAELATLKDEVGSSSALMQLHPPFRLQGQRFVRTANVDRAGTAMRTCEVLLACTRHAV